MLQNCKTRLPRHYWVINYEQRWFEKTIAKKDEPIFQELWKNRFRILPSTFDFNVNLFQADMRKEDTYFRKTISIQKRVACVLWRLSTGNSCRVVSKVFRVGRSAVSQIVKSFAKLYAISLVVLSNFQKQKWRQSQKFKNFKTVSTVRYCWRNIWDTHRNQFTYCIYQN